jgi:hypothetical protein
MTHIIEQLALIQPEIRDEPQAFKRACIRMGYEAAIKQAAEAAMVIARDAAKSMSDEVRGFTAIEVQGAILALRKGTR